MSTAIRAQLRNVLPTQTFMEGNPLYTELAAPAPNYMGIPRYHGNESAND